MDRRYINWLYKLITKNFAEVEFDDDTRECSLTYKDGYSRPTLYKSTITFDKSSASAYSTFQKDFSELLNSKFEAVCRY